MFFLQKKTFVCHEKMNNQKSSKGGLSLKSAAPVSFAHVISHGDFHQIWSVSPHRPTASWDGRSFQCTFSHIWNMEKEHYSLTVQSSRNCSRLLVDSSKLLCRVQRESPEVPKRVFKTMSWICEVIATCYVVQPNLSRNQQVLVLSPSDKSTPPSTRLAQGKNPS